MADALRHTSVNLQAASSARASHHHPPHSSHQSPRPHSRARAPKWSPSGPGRQENALAPSLTPLSSNSEIPGHRLLPRVLRKDALLTVLQDHHLPIPPRPTTHQRSPYQSPMDTLPQLRVPCLRHRPAPRSRLQEPRRLRMDRHGRRSHPVIYSVLASLAKHS